MRASSRNPKDPSPPLLRDPIAQLVGEVLEPLASQIADRVSEKLSCVGSSNIRLLTVDQAGTYLGRTAHAIRHLLAKKALPAVRIDGRIFIDIRDLDQVIDRAKR